MPNPTDPDVDYYDHLPDGTILGKIPFDDADALIALMRERMTPENFKVFAKVILTHGAKRQ